VRKEARHRHAEAGEQRRHRKDPSDAHVRGHP
jgi:hypothetical protein